MKVKRTVRNAQMQPESKFLISKLPNLFFLLFIRFLGKCPCRVGHFENFTEICPPCDKSCKLCIGPYFDQCTECYNDPPNRIFKLIYVDTKKSYGYCGCENK